jgi:hypothetical protein
LFSREIAEARQIDERRDQAAFGADQNVQALAAFAQRLDGFEDRVGAAWLVERRYLR